MPIDTVEVKGLAFRSWLVSFAELYGVVAKTRLQAEIVRSCPELGELVTHGLLLAGSWYPQSWYAKLLEAGRVACPTHPTLHRDVSFHATKTDVKGILKFLVALAGPQVLLRNQQRIMSAFVRGGYTVATETPSPGTMRVTLTDLANTRAGWQDLLGGIEGGIDATGRKNVRVRISEGGKDGDLQCVLSVFFDTHD